MDNIEKILNLSVGNISVQMILKTLLLLLICIVVSRIIMRFFRNILDHTELDSSIRVFTNSIVKLVLVFITVLIAADSLNIPVSSLLTLFGVIGLALSLSVQGIFSNIANGILLLITKPFHPGDFIETTAVSGTVKQTTLLNTQLITADNKLIFIPNSDIASSRITNYSANKTRRVEVRVSTENEVAAADVKAALEEAIKMCGQALEEPEPSVRLVGYGEGSVQYAVRVWTESEDYWSVYYQLHENIKISLDNHSITMNYNKVLVRMDKE